MQIILVNAEKQSEVIERLEMPELPLPGDEVMILGDATYKVVFRRHVPSRYDSAQIIQSSARAFYAVVGVTALPNNPGEPGR